ncbi:MAG TPA: ABC transporter ATP-binding protein [Ignavibacteria bacterium]|nr:ABC transporter ATP-binding protein [Ignavibacteria bacterium]HQY52267.1 ABC transporter ATP-binding protein [Ignavibacteria bacterium]HRB01149.1 ABC transporter ATP-binding protein [Ignavibacteria bacterium]
MKLLYSYLKKYKKLLIIALILAAVNQVFSLLDPFIFRYIIDDYATKYTEYTTSEFFKGVGFLLMLAVGAALISRIAKNIQDYYLNVITQKLGADIYTDGISHSLKLPYSVFEDQSSGQTLGILQKVRTDSEKMISAFVNVMFTSIVGILFVGIYAFSVHWVIAPIYLSAIPIIGLLSSSFGKKIKTIQKTIVDETTALAGSTTESLRNIELVKSLGLSQQEINRLNNTTDKILLLELKKVKYIRSLSFIQGTIVNLLRTSILFIMMYLIFTQAITTGQFFTLFIYSFYIFGPLQELGNIINIYKEAEVSLNNFQEIMNTPVDPKPKDPVIINEIETLEFDDVTFRHKSSNTNALSQISFKTGVGKTIAFVGPSGSGKTTLVKLLLGLYRPIEGNILYNGTPFDKVDLDSLREKIGFVSQDSQLFSGTIRENLLFVNPKATDEECYEVLYKSNCHTLLERADNGLDTVIGEGGVKVSGGEKQRLSIARALLRNPNLMIFDEATSALDSITEEGINKTIREISSGGNHITLMIAHRLSTIMHADTIYVLERGNIIESGKHEELIELKGLYYAMWRQQIGERKFIVESAVLDAEKRMN